MKKFALLLILCAIAALAIAATAVEDRSLKVELDTSLPAAGKIAVYEVVDVEKDLYIDEDVMGRVCECSIDVATKVAEEHIRNRGPADGMVLKVAEVVKMRKIGSEKNESKALGVNLIYGRKVDGLPIIGPEADAIVVFVCGDEIRYYSKLWRKLEKRGEVQVIPAAMALEKLRKGEIVERPMGSYSWLRVKDVELGYYIGSEDQRYLTPVWIFRCTSDIGKISLAVVAVE